MSNTVTLSKHEMVVDRHHEITVVIEGGMCVDVRGLPEDWDYTIEDYDVFEETYSEQMQSELEPIEKEEEN
ncbi:MAG: hypothetical protein FI729_00735 [SAR202 cluster bacterium]|nr:hypothetical protein [SAR202 cluster bacterium]|tara:strand:- start:1315 stop:1527 length:213 start_codon:yes stop_codon:yes gene_type:complete